MKAGVTEGGETSSLGNELVLVPQMSSQMHQRLTAGCDQEEVTSVLDKIHFRDPAEPKT